MIQLPEIKIHVELGVGYLEMFPMHPLRRRRYCGVWVPWQLLRSSQIAGSHHGIEARNATIIMINEPPKLRNAGTSRKTKTVSLDNQRSRGLSMTSDVTCNVDGRRPFICVTRMVGISSQRSHDGVCEMITVCWFDVACLLRRKVELDVKECRCEGLFRRGPSDGESGRLQCLPCQHYGTDRSKSCERMVY